MSLSNDPVDKLFIFVHIPKTAGTTLSRIIEDQYKGNEFWKYSYDYQVLIEKANKMKCVIGHFPFGVHQHIKRPYTYLTMLRDPVERLISLYYFWSEQAFGNVQNVSFEEFIDSPIYDANVSNGQTLYLAGGLTPDLEKAKENLINHFAVPGIMEMFNESLFFIKNECGWNVNHYQLANKGKTRPAEIPFSKGVLELVKSKNELDLELYQFAKNLLETKIKQLNSDQTIEFNKFINQVRQH
ncbi:MAG: sulfotransferase family 2 domain-containing protein [Bacillota bacterium]